MNKLALPNLGEMFRGFRLNLFEWIALITTLVFVGVVTFYYLNSTQPLRSKLSGLRTREIQLQSQIKDSTEKEQALTKQRDNAGKILDSLDSFESRLHNRKVGITAIIDEVNQMAKSHRVTAGDITFRTDAPEPLPGEVQPGASPGATATPAPITRRDRLPVVYEGLGIDTTVEGDYADLRRFISALERSRNFVIINAIALQSIDEKQRSKFKLNNAVPGSPIAAQPGIQQPGGAVTPGGAPAIEGVPDGPSKIVVSLKIEMETHFSRINQTPATMTPVNAPPQK